MEICHDHNLNRPSPRVKPYGIRVSMPPGEPLTHVLGSDWETYHWYSTAERRDRALADRAGEHLYSRRGDRPTLTFEPVERRPD